MFVYKSSTPLPPGVVRETVLEILQDHVLMIDVSPDIQERHPIANPAKATLEERHYQWYEITHRVRYLPWGLLTGSVSFNACFEDLADGVLTHIYAPMGVQIRGRWTVGESMPGEHEIATAETAKDVVPSHQALYLHEESTVKCNILLSGVIKNNLKESHGVVVARILARARLSPMSKEINDATRTASAASSPQPASHQNSRFLAIALILALGCVLASYLLGFDHLRILDRNV